MLNPLLRCGLAVLFLGAIFVAADAAESKATRLTVSVDKPGIAVSPLLYGIFFEEINHAGDGGIYAEMVRNRSFEEPLKDKTIPGWELVTGQGGAGKISVETDRPMSAKNPHFLRLQIENANGRVGIANEGFRGSHKESNGMCVKQGAEYLLSLSARSSTGQPLIVSLESPNSVLLASGTVSAPGKEWTKLTCRLVATASGTDARLAVAGNSAGTVDLDMISLFPRDTWKGRENGWRPDLIQKLVDMKPAFMRFPGGCWVEGNSLEDAYRWKRTIGEVADRATVRNLWHYYSCNGLGFYEYLLLCEDLAAEPLFCINCAMSHTEMRTQPTSLDGVDEYIQDALDAIEYANGPADSRWGSLRAKAGHPKPFNLKYMEIGNENGGAAYKVRYAAFRKAIKAKYPEMHLVCDSYEPPADTIEISDEHYYSSPEFFATNADKYDRYDRARPKVFVGEYAVTQGSGAGNLLSAIGEAAFMTGMERNADQVLMASYAPLFADVHYKGWNPDAICFDNSRVYGTPSYHVQALFAKNRGDVNLPVSIEQPVAARPHTGAIGVGTWHTSAEFKDIVVTRGERELWRSDFSKGTDDWRLEHGQWSVEDGALRQTAVDKPCLAEVGDPFWTDYTVRLKARKLGGSEGFLIRFLARPDQERIWWNIGGWKNTAHGVEGAGGSDKVPGKIETGRWYDIRIEINADRIQCFLDDRKIHDCQLVSPKSVFAVAGRVNGTGEVVLKVVNVSGAEMTAAIDLQGVERVAFKGLRTVLTGPAAATENTLALPERVLPVTAPVAIDGPQFKQTLPPWSVSVLRVKAE